VSTADVPGLDVDGPVQAEVFLLWLDNGAVALTGPCGAEPWYLHVDAGGDPLAVVEAALVRVVGQPRVVHSTSWRRDRDAVVLSFVAVVDPDLTTGLSSVPVVRTDLARGTATTAPARIATTQVLEHGLRHLAWLVRDDPAVATSLPDAWLALLDRYVPEPFRHLR